MVKESQSPLTLKGVKTQKNLATKIQVDKSCSKPAGQISRKKLLAENKRLKNKLNEATLFIQDSVELIKILSWELKVMSGYEVNEVKNGQRCKDKAVRRKNNNVKKEA